MSNRISRIDISLSCRVRRPGSRRLIAIVEPIQGWTPSDCFDRPPSADIMDVLPCPMTRAEAACFAMGHNSAAMADGARRWVVALPGESSGRCDRFCDLRSRSLRRATLQPA